MYSFFLFISLETTLAVVDVKEKYFSEISQVHLTEEGTGIIQNKNFKKIKKRKRFKLFQFLKLRKTFRKSQQKKVDPVFAISPILGGIGLSLYFAGVPLLTTFLMVGGVILWNQILKIKIKIKAPYRIKFYKELLSWSRYHPMMFIYCYKIIC